MTDWLYQIRIKVSERLSEDLRGARNLAISKNIHKIASDTGCRIVCTFDAFADYCAEAEKEGCLLYTSPSPRDKRQSRMPSSA